jgi:hypothetical protein
MFHIGGLSDLLEGDLEQADASFARAYDLAASIDSSPSAALVLTEQFLIAVERDEWTAADSLIKRSVEIVTGGPFDGHWTSALVYAAAAHAAWTRSAESFGSFVKTPGHLGLRKLGVSSSTEAVDRMVELGLLWAAPVGAELSRAWPRDGPPPVARSPSQ